MEPTTVQHTIIDGDILEDTFEDLSGEFDRFTHVIVCDPAGVFFRAVPYMYARNITRVRELLAVVTLAEYPDLNQYAIRDELLKLKSHNPALICSLVDKQDNILPSLHQELRELETLDMLDESSARSLSLRLLAFLKTVKVGDYDGDGIFWLPENYQGEGDIVTQEYGEDYEDYMRRAVCRHIKCRRLPMVHLIPIPEERGHMLLDLVASLSNYHCQSSISNHAQSTHFAPLFRNRCDIRPNGLKTLMAEEFRCVKNETNMDGNATFVFNSAQLDLAERTIPTNKALDNLRYYVGYYLDELDLSRSFITGSAITACLIKTVNDYEYENRELMIDLLYPKVLTTLDDDVEQELRNDNINLWDIYAISEIEGVARKGSKYIHFTIKSGADVDLSVDNTVSDEEYRQIAQSHLEVVRKYYPYVKMRDYQKPKGDWNYVIYTDDPKYLPVFRTIEIYRSSFRHICSHHVGAVRGCYTARWSEQPQFYLTASGVVTSMTRSTPNYHYFAGRKSNPQDIIVKNMQRGIGVSDEVLCSLINNYIGEKNIFLSRLPFYEGRNVPYSLFAAPLEYPFIQERLQRQQEREALQHRTNQLRGDRGIRNQAERHAFLVASRLPKGKLLGLGSPYNTDLAVLPNIGGIIAPFKTSQRASNSNLPR